MPTEALALYCALHQYRHVLLPLAKACSVRYVTAWRAAQGLPMRAADAALLWAGLIRLTGIPFPASVAGKTPELPETDGRRERRGG